MESINPNLSANEFERAARVVMSKFFETQLWPKRIEGIPKIFDFVSDDFQIVGDAKYLTMVKSKYTPPAKFSIISEHVWLLDNCQARVKFLVFGREKEVPKKWLEKHVDLVKDVNFFFLTEQGILESLLINTKLDKTVSNFKFEKSLFEIIKMMKSKKINSDFMDSKLSLADRIREFVLINYINKAREQGLSKISLRSGDIHSEMNLHNRMPAVCGALDARKFQDQNAIRLIDRKGPKQGANVYFTFQIL